MAPSARVRAAVTILFILTVSGCADETVPEPYQPSNAHERYSLSLERAGLGQTELGRAWVRASQEVFEDHRAISLPFREVLLVDHRMAFVAGYRFSSHPGRRVEIALSRTANSSGRVFADLFRIKEEAEPVHVASLSPLDRQLVFEPRREADYVLRVQPELLSGGQLDLSLQEEPILRFPVAGRDTGAIRSRFGVARDGGRRRHRGVDIFAPRNTPVMAATRGRVTRVQETSLGGRVVWVRDLERNLHLYYAHLEVQKVAPGSWVEAGDVVGLVGNSGNARTTAPHLHFGIYQRGVGPIDPWNFLVEGRGQPEFVAVPPESLGSWGLSRERSTLTTHSRIAVDIPAGTPLQIDGITAREYRVTLPSGRVGYLKRRQLQLPLEPVEKIRLQQPVVLRASVPPAGRAICRAPADAMLSVLGQVDGFALIQTPGCNAGWIAQAW